MRKKNSILFEEAIYNLEKNVKNVFTYQDMENFVITLIKQGNFSTAISILAVLDNAIAAWYFFDFDSITGKIVTLYPIICQEDVEKVIREITGEKEWIPTKFGVFPAVRKMVQVTYRSYNNGRPLCDEFAYMEEDGVWRWGHDDEVPKVKITAWKYINEPYTGE